MIVRFALLLLIAGAALAQVPAALADGDDFFVIDDGGPPILQYRGHVRDSAGQPLAGVSVFVEVKHPRVFVNTKSVADGGYKSPDVGLYLDQLSGGEVDISQLQMRAVKSGYKTVYIKVPEKKFGLVDIEITMTPDS